MLYGMTFHRRWSVVALVGIALIGGALAVWRGAGPAGFWKPQQEVRFSRDIRPILNQNCVQCHGGVRQKNGVSFIFRDEALGVGKSGHRTIVPGKPDDSELIARVTSKDPEARMPYHAAPLPPQQIALLRQWIKEGAKWEDHWAFVPPKPEPVPAVKRSGWVRQPLDKFILARQEREGLEPSPEADRSSLLRRVSLDLIGLPPTPEEQAAYLADSSSDAYEKQVDRLLASPRYGERWAALWLDLARYADSKGYEADRGRPGVWPYRDWVIDAFNQNLPYDQFVIKQIAGDLLPNATFEDQIATSFHRQTPNNDEGGTDDEEFRLVAAMDRSATTWSVLNGLTMNCVQCHSHPYDPIRHADYYKSLAFFNTSRDADLPEDTPVLHVPKDKTKYPEAARLQQEIAKGTRSVADVGRQLDSQTHWMPAPIVAASASESAALLWDANETQHDLADLNDAKLSAKQKEDKRKELLKDIAETRKLARAKESEPRVTIPIQDGEMRAPTSLPGRLVYELIATVDTPTVSAVRIEVLPLNADAARHTPEDGFIVDQIDAWVIQPNGRRDKIPFRYFISDSEENLEAAVQRAVAFGPKSTGDRRQGAFAANPNLFRPRWTIGVPLRPLQISPGTRLKVHLTQTENITDKPAHVKRARIAATTDASWTSMAKDPTFGANLEQLIARARQLSNIPSVETPIMAEESDYERRDTREFDRGNFLTKIGPSLQPDVPALFPKPPEGAPRNRLTFARWFFAPDQPLTARTTVNRYWEQLFGTGIVETLENFGSVGEEPSHPELLDWLALHFQNDLRWDMKALLREIVTSATYRQSAKSTPVLTEKDPRNRLLARGPQQRLTAEMVRDQALMAGGLLTDKMGGPPVMPPQPEGVWNSVYNDSKWVDATGPDRYRRAIYTYIKRTSGYPSFLTFDASEHDVSLARRISTNTPLQALVTLNDPVYQEASEALARRMMKSADALDGRLRYGARLVLSRDPTNGELATLRSLYEEALTAPSAPRLVKVSAKVQRSSSKDLAAMTAVASVLFNLDAALTR